MTEKRKLLTSYRIETIETKIAAGLIEEVVVVAENELELVREMLKARPYVLFFCPKHELTLRRWDPLEEQSPPGQWTYFERGDRV